MRGILFYIVCLTFQILGLFVFNSMGHIWRGAEAEYRNDISKSNDIWENRYPNGLLKPQVSGQKGAQLSAGLKALIDGIPELLLIFLNTNPKSSIILEQNPRLVKYILSLPDILKYYVNRPQSTYMELVPREFDQIIERLLRENTEDAMDLWFKILTNYRNGDMDRESKLKFLTAPSIKELLSSPYIVEFIANFPLDWSALPYDPQARRKMMKLFLQDPVKGLDESDQLRNSTFKDGPLKLDL